MIGYNALSLCGGEQSHFGHATFSGFERFDVLIVGVMANFWDIITMPYSVIVLVNNAEGIVR